MKFLVFFYVNWVLVRLVVQKSVHHISKHAEIINEQGVQEIKPLPIITIYFLAYKLDNVTVPVLKVQNCYYDVIRNERIEDIGDESFIHLLNHESYTIQIPYLKNET